MTESAARGGRPRSRPAVRLDLGRRLRVLAGVDEGILDQVPLERTRYVGLGGVVLGTAIVAGVSMWFALGQVLGGVHLAMAVPSVIWLLIVLNLDRWLVSTVAGMWQHRLMMLIPRLLVAVVLGSIIAEPLVLRVFETAVVQHVIDEREAARVRERALLVACNPVTAAPPPGRGCENARILASGAEADEAKISELEKDAAKLREQVRVDGAEYDRLFKQATAECMGEKIKGVTSGKRGVGPLCRRLENAARKAKAGSDLDGNRRRLGELQSRISELRGPLADKRSDFGNEVRAKIDERLSAMPDKEDPVGILERMRALHAISSENTYLFAASWLFRLFLVLIDCLPVLVKLMGGTTTYDRMVEHANRMQERIHDKRVQLSADAQVGELELQAHREAEERRRRRQLIDIEGKAADAEARALREELMNKRAEELKRQSRQEGRINGNHPRVDLAGSFR
ncbi:DUF4407 domain-containing protein [Streptosporangium carneum]|uniref:DUF4407 domain-containing protein n=1 Tax=Streptosporangium carneum TaxID=47481 RepID=A0A9W6MAJ2_9ACTN|nr:DUF4407 domain-containing protein [Streptosporangium carneum]GLK06718.1 hypothetical protein GCM10017600_01230 [Streptosporangium carneum]